MRKPGGRAGRSERPPEDPALDLLADLLRLLGETAIDLDETSATDIHEIYEGWARHLLVGAPRPGAGVAAADEPLPLARRDFPGARRHAVHHRRLETEYVRRSLAVLRETLWSFIRGLGNAFAEDRDADSALKAQMSRVQHAVESSSIEEIRRESLAAVGAMGRVLAECRRKQRVQFEALGEHVRNLREELEQTRARMERDPLTQVFNRAALDEHVRRVADLGTLFGEPAWIYVVDVDHFKWVNDRFGHPAGDDVLRQVAASLQKTLQRREDFVARYGGDEFVAVLSVRNPGDATIVAERLIGSVRDVAVRRASETIRVSASIGFAAYRPGEPPKTWLERADVALYRAKEQGRDRALPAEG